MLETKIAGLDDLQALLNTLPSDIEKKVMRGAMRAGMKVVMDRARSGVPTRLGNLAGSMRMRASARNGRVAATITVGSKRAFYAHMVEFGTKAHEIRPKGKKSLFFAGLAREIVHHPGAKAKPFLRPALDAAASENSEAFQAVKDYLEKRINKEISKLPDETDDPQ